MSFAVFGPPAGNEPGFRVIAGRHTGLQDLMVISGRLLAGDVSPVHRHDGEEVLRVLSGALQVRVGEQTQRCGRGDVAIVPAAAPHGFVVATEAVVEVVARYRSGTMYPVLEAGVEVWVEVYRRDMPWGRPPPEGASWTSDEDLQSIVRRVSRQV